MLLEAVVKQFDPQQPILLRDSTKQLEWIKAIENIGTDTQKVVNSLDFEEAQVVASKFQELLSKIKGVVS